MQELNELYIYLVVVHLSLNFVIEMASDYISYHLQFFLRGEHAPGPPTMLGSKLPVPSELGMHWGTPIEFPRIATDYEREEKIQQHPTHKIVGILSLPGTSTQRWHPPPYYIYRGPSS